MDFTVTSLPCNPSKLSKVAIIGITSPIKTTVTSQMLKHTCSLLAC